MVLDPYSAEQLDKWNNQQQGFLLIAHLVKMGYRLGVTDNFIVLTAPDGLQFKTSS